MRKLDKKFGKMVSDGEINEIGEELNIDEIETNLLNDVIPKPEEFGKSPQRNTYFMRRRYVPAGCTTNFSFGFIPRKTASFEDIDLTLISQTGYILDIDGARNREKVIEHWKRGMNSVCT